MFEDGNSDPSAADGVEELAQRLGARPGEALSAALEAAADPERLARLDEPTLVALVLASQRTIEWAQRLRGAALEDLDRRRLPPARDGRLPWDLRLRGPRRPAGPP